MIKCVGAQQINYGCGGHAVWFTKIWHDGIPAFLCDKCLNEQNAEGHTFKKIEPLTYTEEHIKEIKWTVQEIIDQVYLSDS